jgi:RNA polymerase sigma factor (sigma-70 family)
MASMDGPTRESLIRRVRDPGDSRSWDEFWRLYEPLIAQYLRRLRVSPHDSADLVQEVYLKLRREMPRFSLDHARGQFRGWLRRMTDNTVRDHFRNLKRRQDRLEDAADYMRAVQESFDDGAQRDAVREREWRQNVLETILQRARQEFAGRANLWACFEKTLIQRLPAKQVAAELGIEKVNNVYVYAHRVLTRIRALQAEYDPEADGSGDSTQPVGGES